MAETKPPAFTTFGEMLKHLRQRAQMTQDELGLAVGYSRAHIARLESNQRVPDAGAVKARFFLPLDIEPDSQEASLLVKLAQAARATPSFIEESELPPATPSIPNNLPYELTSFIGREQALAELERLLPATRLLTLTGTGGTGKTRLALKLAERVMSDYPDGVWLVELAPLSDPAQVPAATLSALNLRELPDKSPTASLIAHLQNKQLLLILDNCEHVIDACAALADALLRGCKHLRVLCTSREALGIAGELAWRVPSLSLPANADMAALQASESAALFVERAIFASSSFKLTAENAPAVLGICKRLDGIPLAIELAAARVKALTPAEIAARLDDRFRLLAGGSRTALPRQQTLQAAVDWSYRLLSEQERLLLSRLAVFIGGWTLAAAEHVCAGDGIERDDVLALLSRLVDKSLVAVDDAGVETRYFLLETIRQYAIEKLNAGDEAKTMRDRHLDYFLTLLAQVFDELSGMNAKDQISMVKRLGPDIDNIRQTIRWALDTGRAEAAYKLVFGFQILFIAHAGENELLAWTLQIGEDKVNAEALRAESLFLANTLYSRTGRGQQARQLVERVQVMIEKLDKPLLRYDVLSFLSHYARVDKRFGDARRLDDERYELATRLQLITSDEMAIEQASTESEYAFENGDFPRAIAGLQKLYDYAHRVGSKMVSTAMGRRLGYALLFAGDPSSAPPYFRESMIDNHAFGDRLAVSACMFAFGTLAEKTSDLPRAACLFAAAIKVRTSAGLPNMPWDVDMYQPSLTAVQAQLDQPELAAMWAKGDAMTLEQAMAFALDE